MEQEEDEIDLGRVLSILLEKKKLVATIVGICTIVAMVISLLLPKQYTSTAMVQSSTTGKDLGGAAALAAMAGVKTSASSPIETYIEMMKTRTVLDPIIEQVYTDRDEEKKDWPQAADFAKDNLKIENAKSTSLITVAATGKSPEEAKFITEGVITNFLSLMTDLNQNSQSLLVKFLGERIDVAKKEADDASQKLEQYSKEHKVYEPSEQTKAVIEKSAAYDKTLGELQVEQQAASATFGATSAQLGEENANALNYDMADNTTVSNLRTQIVNQEVNLVGLRQKYTEEHPDVIRAKEQLAALNQSLNNAVSDAVGAGINVSDTNTQIKISRYQAAATMAAASASSEKVKELQSQSEGELKELADGILEYTKLKRDAEIKNQIYTNLIQQSETAKIKQTMESMDIQIVDPANLPDEKKPSGPKKKLITLGGFAVGIIISLGYAFFLYFKEERQGL